MIKAKVNHNGFYQGVHYFKGKETELPDDAIAALGEENVEVLETIDEPKKEKKEKKEDKALGEAPQDKQLKTAVVSK